MTPEMAYLIEQLRDWHTRSTASSDTNEWPRLLGEGEATVAALLRLVDQEPGQ